MYQFNKKTGLLLPGRTYASGYSEAGASRTRRSLRGINSAVSSSPQEDIDYNNFTLRQRSRILYMASPVAASAINTTRTNIIGTGLILQATPDNNILGLSPEALQEWTSAVESEFRLWAESKACDCLGLNNFYEIQQLALKSWLMSGDVFILIKRQDPTAMMPYTLRLHVIEADRVSTPYLRGAVPGGITTARLENGNYIYDGIETNPEGKIVAYHISRNYPLEMRVDRTQEWTRVEAYGPRTGLPNVLHIMDSERPDSYRGVPLVAPIIEPLLQLRRYTEAELTAAFTQSCQSAWIQTENDPSVIPFNETGAGDIEGYEGEGGISDDENEYEIGPGTINVLKTGERVVFNQPTNPNTNFDSFVHALCRMMGSALEIPYELLMKEFTSSYSASRGALLEAWKMFRMRRHWFVDDFCAPVYEMFLTEAVATGRIKAPGFWDDPLIRKAWCGSQWVGPTHGILDPTKEVQASILQVQSGFKSRSQVTRELNGSNWPDVVQQLASEKALLSELGLNLTEGSEGGATEESTEGNDPDGTQ